MKKLKKIDLPRKYEYKEGITNPDYKKFNGWNKISYSQFSSFLDDEEEGYRGGYIAGYFLKIRDDGNVFSYFGSACGDYLNTEDQRVDEYLDSEDIKPMDELITKHPEGAVFEFEILIDLEPFGLEKTCLQGFTDRQHLTEEDTIDITDYKTLNIEKKKAFYASDKYKQTQVYGYGLEEMGYKIGKTYVTGLGRKGNKLDKEALHFNGKTNMGLRLSGEVEIIDNPYDRKKAKKAIEKIADTCLQIDKYYKVYKKLFV